MFVIVCHNGCGACVLVPYGEKLPKEWAVVEDVFAVCPNCREAEASGPDTKEQRSELD